MNQLPSTNSPSKARLNQRQVTIFGYGLVVLMMVTLGIGVAQFGERLFTGWQGGYMGGIGLLIAIEAIATRKHTQDLELREGAIFHISEWIAIAVAIKIILYLVHGPEQLLRDLPLWQANFVANFFTGEYIAALIVAGLVWLASVGYASDLEDLYNREVDTRWDELGKLQNAMHDVRQRVITRIFIIGALVVTLAVFSRIDASEIFRTIGKPPPDYYAPVVNVLAYFVMALVMLSQTQFALLQVRWLWQSLPVSPSLAKNWIKYALIFFLILTVIVFLLPTEYSLGLFDTLRYALEFLVQAATFFIALLAIPFSLCLSLFNLTSPKSGQTQPIQPPTQIFPAQPAGQPIAWLEFLRSLIFWAIFLGVIFFALRFYLSQNAELWQAITGFPLFRWISGAWKGLWNWIKGANQQISGLVQDGIKRMRAQRVAPPVQGFRRFFNFSRLNPREKIIYFYLSLVELGGERGLERKPAQTPYQYENRLDSAVPEVNQELRELTETFLEARYSQHPVEQPHAEQANSLWERIKAVLKNWKREG